MFWEPVEFTIGADDRANGEIRLDFIETLGYFKLIIANAHIANGGSHRILLLPSWVEKCHSLAGITLDGGWGVETAETGGFYLGRSELGVPNASFSTEYTFANFGENTIGKGESAFAIENGHVIGFECVGRAANNDSPSVEKWLKILYPSNATMKLDDDVVLLKGRLGNQDEIG